MTWVNSRDSLPIWIHLSVASDFVWEIVPYRLCPNSCAKDQWWLGRSAPTFDSCNLLLKIRTRAISVFLDEDEVPTIDWLHSAKVRPFGIVWVWNATRHGKVYKYRESEITYTKKPKQPKKIGKVHVELPTSFVQWPLTDQAIHIQCLIHS